MADSGSGSEYATWDRARLQDRRRELQRDLDKPLPAQFDRDSDIKSRWQAMIGNINAELEFREGRRRPQRSVSPDGPPSPMKLAGEAVRNYFTRNNINPRPRYETVQIDLAWEHAGRKYLGTYLTASHSLQVWVKVVAGTSGATTKGDDYYMPVT